ncbi:hypothetical protein [Priestia flexa]|uniref:Uncharacterized protein n=1 Tax=Priestia flexa TaxID=86664 RepID=A0ABU4J287_9BACI|nr:hypothetical protein [Priestia flexa]MDW8515102.1 hypothetical protein [Priestia flexa]
MNEIIVAVVILSMFYLISAVAAWIATKRCCELRWEAPGMWDLFCVVTPFLNTFRAMTYSHYIEMKKIDTSWFFRMKVKK